MIRIEDHQLPLNPFIYDLKVDLIEFKEETYIVTVVEGMNSPTGQMNSMVKTVEAAGFTKIYDIPYKSGFIKSFTKPELILFLHILYNLESNIDYLILDPEKVCKKLGFSIKTLKTSLSGLTANSVIKRMTRKHGDYRYWINPKIMFKGDRQTYMKDRLSENCQVVKTITNKNYLGSITS